MFTSLTVKFPERLDEHGNPKPPPKWHAYNLIPQTTEFGIEAESYSMKMLCWEIAQGDIDRYEKLYEQKRESDVIELYGMFLAKLYPIE